MHEGEFRAWLSHQLQEKTISDYVSNIKRVEVHFGDLDMHYDSDRLVALLDALTSPPAGDPPHRIPIDGDVRNVTSTLKSAVKRYQGFRDATG